jgi:hypothetical protein
MISLVREFAERIYRKYSIDRKTGKYSYLYFRLKYEQFKEWIMQNKKLFYSYYSAFHQEIWQFYDGLPQYLIENKIEKCFEGKLYYEKKMQPACFMLVVDAIVICDSKKSMKRPFKIICLQGLNIK